MKLIKCHIDNFGGISGLDLSFTDGLNVLLKENGWGKTTLAVFIKSMLYGLPQTKSRSLDLNERSKYLPWQGGKFGGYLDFETDRGGTTKKYRIQRSFSKKPIEDTFSLVDLGSGEKSSDFSENLGEELFGIDSDAYSKSTYIPQLRQEDRSGSTARTSNSSITAKLTNLLESSDDMGEYQNAVDLLDKSRKRLYTTGGNGEVNRLDRTISELTEKQKSATESAGTLEKLEKTAAELEEKLNDANDKYKKTSLLLSETSDKISRSEAEKAAEAETRKNVLEQAEHLRSNLLKKNSDYVGMLGFFSGVKPDKELLSKLSSLASVISGKEDELKRIELPPEVNERYDTLNRRFADQLPDQAFTDRLTELNNRKAVKGDRAAGTVLAVLAVLSVIGAAALQNRSLFAGITFLVLGVIFAASSAIILRKSGRKNISREIDLSLKKFYPDYDPSDNGSRLQTINRLTEEVAEFKRLDTMIAISSSQAEETEKSLADLRANFADVLTALKVRQASIPPETDYADAASLVAEKAKDLEFCYQSGTDAKKELDEYENKHGDILNSKPQDQGGDQDTETAENSLALLKEKVAELDKSRSDIVSELASVKTSCGHYSEKAENLDSITSLLDRTTEERDNLVKRHRATVRAIELLDLAKKNLSQRYLSDMRSAFNRMMASVTGDEENDSYMLDASFNITAERAGELRDFGYFSQGYRDLMDVCLRLSLTDALFKDEKPCLILDDPFTALDSEKLKKASELISEISGDRQVIYFICHESRK